MAIHRKPPAYDELAASDDLLETGIKVIDWFVLSPKAVRLDSSVVPVLVKP